MSLEHAILGFLSYKPYSGYDLKKVFDLSVRHFWPADQSQIYRTLTKLIEKGWAQVEVIQQEDRPNRKVYHITETGQAELHCWLTTPLPPFEPRNAHLIQVYFAGQLKDEEILPIFRRMSEEIQKLSERYHQIPQDIESCTEHDSPRQVFFWMLTLEFGVKMVQAQLEWLESVIQRIENREHPN